MANANIDNLSAAVSLNGIELVEIMQGGINKKTTTQDIADLGGGATPTLDEVIAEGSTLTAARVVDIAGNSLDIDNGVNSLLNIQPAVSRLQSSDGTNVSKIDLRGDSGNDIAFELTANNGVNEVQIYADAGENTLEYTADTHTFTGNIISATLLAASFADDAAAAAGGIAVGGLYRTAGAVKIRLS